MQITLLKNINQTNFKKTAENKTISTEQTDLSEQNGNKKLKMALTCLGIAGAAVALGLGGKAVYRHFHPKTAKGVGSAVAGNTTSSVNTAMAAKNKFLTSSGEEVTVTFQEKGIATVGDNLFTGNLEQTKTVDGKEIKTVVEYIKGKAQRTTVDGLRRKSFIYNYDGSETINFFNEKGDYISSRTHYYDPKTGRIKEACVLSGK